MLSSVSDKAKLFAIKAFLKALTWITQVTLPVFTSRTNLKMRNISATSKLVKKVIMNLDSSKALILIIVYWLF